MIHPVACALGVPTARPRNVCHARHLAWRRWISVALAVLGVSAAIAGTQHPASTIVSGAADGNAPAWSILTTPPADWTADCCTYARAIGVNAVMYQGAWSGKPNRVIVLNVWPRKLANLDAELRADRTHYLARDPAAKTSSFPLRHRSMKCAANVFQGTDHLDDVVVFCDPGHTSGVRLSWSLSFADGDATRRALLDDFMRTVVSARYARGKTASP